MYMICFYIFILVWYNTTCIFVTSLEFTHYFHLSKPARACVCVLLFGRAPSLSPSLAPVCVCVCSSTCSAIALICDVSTCFVRSIYIHERTYTHSTHTDSRQQEHHLLFYKTKQRSFGTHPPPLLSIPLPACVVSRAWQGVTITNQNTTRTVQDEMIFRTAVLSVSQTDSTRVHFITCAYSYDMQYALSYATNAHGWSLVGCTIWVPYAGTQYTGYTAVLCYSTAVKGLTAQRKTTDNIDIR